MEREFKPRQLTGALLPASHERWHALGCSNYLAKLAKETANRRIFLIPL